MPTQTLPPYLHLPPFLLSPSLQRESHYITIRHAIPPTQLRHYHRRSSALSFIALICRSDADVAVAAAAPASPRPILPRRSACSASPAFPSPSLLCLTPASVSSTLPINLLLRMSFSLSSSCRPHTCLSHLYSFSSSSFFSSSSSSSSSSSYTQDIISSFGGAHGGGEVRGEADLSEAEK
ncbi:hypothetical protein E2C01_046720 [Portunus trituberculatus]|uniref:Uncharacterized protein n=1 Tax=Portunus trituberculatus TaxID=210409 RepID=A0A5B7FZA8_PORTR|nr:hypothetical protein [Portunus trituberculatus]